MLSNLKNKNTVFWIVQVVGWTMVNSVSILIVSDQLNGTYLVSSFLSYTIFGILITSILRFYFKRNVNFYRLSKKDVFKLIVSTILTGFIFLFESYIFEWLYNQYGNLTKLEKEFLYSITGFWSGLVGSFFTMFGWVFLYCIIKIILQYNQARIDKLELNTILKEAQLNTLKGQVNPHFMFNSLNNIRGLMLEDVEKSREMLSKLSEMLEYALVKNTTDAIPLSEELEMVENYMALSKIQFEDRLTYIKEIDRETLKISIPPMIIQLLVENACKHGISNLKSGGTVTLRIYKEDSNLFIQVKNTGKLSIEKNSTKLGLKNIKQRLKLQYGNEGYFSLDEVGDEVVANIKIPLV